VPGLPVAEDFGAGPAFRRPLRGGRPPAEA